MKVDKEANNKRKHPIVEFMDDPRQWHLDNPEYTWLTEENKEYLDSFGFDYGDIMDCAGHFNTHAQVKQILFATDRELDNYCQTLWKGKTFDEVYSGLLLYARNKSVEDIFQEWAQRGSSTAIAIMAKSVIKLDGDEANKPKDLRIRIVNDLEGDEDEEEAKAIYALDDDEDGEGDN